MSNLGFGLISADSHIVEPADCYSKYIGPKYRDRAPTIERDAHGNDIYVIPGMESTIPLGLVAAAGLSAEELGQRRQGCTFDQLHESGHNAKYRVADQERDGVAAPSAPGSGEPFLAWPLGRPSPFPPSRNRCLLRPPSVSPYGRRSTSHIICLRSPSSPRRPPAHLVFTRCI